MIIVRKARVADAEAIAQVHIETWRTTYAGIVPADHLANLSTERSAQRWRDSLDNPRPGAIHLVVDLPDHGIVGFAAGGAERDRDPVFQGEIYALNVLSPFQRRGIGRRLVDGFVNELRQQGINSLLIWVLRDNPARAFYDRLGGQLLREREIVIGGATLQEVAFGWPDLRGWRGDATGKRQERGDR